MTIFTPKDTHDEIHDEIHEEIHEGTKTLVFDFETSGLPDRNGLPFGVPPPYNDLEKYSNCRAVELCIIVCDDRLNKQSYEHYIIKRDGFSINNSQFHHITNEISDTKGVSFKSIVPILTTLIETSTTLIAHNLDFDINVLKSELYRIGATDLIKSIDSKKHVCSMKETKELVGIKNYYGYKFPSLLELYEFATSKKITNAHRAKSDTEHLLEACKVLYDKGLLKGYD